LLNTTRRHLTAVSTPKRSPAAKKSVPPVRRKTAVGGITLASLSGGIELVRVAKRSSKPATAPQEQTEALFRKAVSALKRPGIPRETVFKAATTKPGAIFSYAIDPSDTTRVIREAPDGTRTIGRLKNGKFVQLRP